MTQSFTLPVIFVRVSFPLLLGAAMRASAGGAEREQSAYALSAAVFSKTPEGLQTKGSLKNQKDNDCSYRYAHRP